METVGTLVVGAGISGLAYAHARLRAPDGDVLVLEASARAGGLVHTIEEQGFRFEAGPEALSAGGHAVELARELGVEVLAAPSAASKRFVQLDGRLVEVPLSPPRLLASPLLTWRGKLRLLSEPWRAAGAGCDGSIADFARARLGAEALERLIDPVVAGIHAGDPEQLSLRACFPEIARWVTDHGSLFAALRARRRAAGPGKSAGGGLWKPRGGMQRLTDALSRALGPRVRLGQPVRSIARDGDGFRVASDTAEHRARSLVLALPLDATRRLLGSLAPEAAAALAAMAAESLVSIVHAHARDDVAHPLDGFGYLVPRSAGGALLGTLFSSTLDPASTPGGTVLLRSLLGGARHPWLTSLGDDELLALVQRECSRPLGLRRAPRFARILRHERALPRFDLTHPSRQLALERGLPSGLVVLGNFTRGIGLGSLVAEARQRARRSS